METFQAISPSEWAARKTRFGELLEKMGAVGLTNAEKAERRSLQRWLASHQGRQDAKKSNSLLKDQVAWDRNRRETGISRFKKRLSPHFRNFRCPKQPTLGGALEFFSGLLAGTTQIILRNRQERARRY